MVGRSIVNATELLAGGCPRLFCRTVQVRLLPSRRVRLSLAAMHLRAHPLFGGGHQAAGTLTDGYRRENE